MAISPRFPNPQFDFLKVKNKEKKKRGECPNCNSSNVTSFSRDDMVWKKCNQCPHTWTIGGTSILFKTGMDRTTFMREVHQEPDLISVGAEKKRNMIDWELDNKYISENNQRYIDFINEVDGPYHEDD